MNREDSVLAENNDKYDFLVLKFDTEIKYQNFDNFKNLGSLTPHPPFLHQSPLLGNQWVLTSHRKTSISILLILHSKLELWPVLRGVSQNDDLIQ